MRWDNNRVGRICQILRSLSNFHWLFLDSSSFPRTCTRMSVVEAVLQTLGSLKFESTNADQSDGRPTVFDNETLETAVSR